VRGRGDALADRRALRTNCDSLHAAFSGFPGVPRYAGVPRIIMETDVEQVQFAIGSSKAF